MSDGDVDGYRPALVGGRGVPAIGNPGRAACELPAGEPLCAPMLADHELSEFATPDLQIRAASIRGLMHRYRGEPRQDAFSVTHDPDSATTVVVVCDGVGSLPRSHEAAAYVVAQLPSLFWAHRDWGRAVRAVNADLRELADQVRDPELPAGEWDENGMATTVVAVAITPGPCGWRVRIVRSDDSTVWALWPDGTWTALSADADADAGVHTGSVRALPVGTPRLSHVETVVEGGALFVMTDGVDGPLRDAKEVRATLAAWWSTPPTVFDFGSQVGFARKTHLDDRTVVGVWPRTAGGDRE